MYLTRGAPSEQESWWKNTTVLLGSLPLPGFSEQITKQCAFLLTATDAAASLTESSLLEVDGQMTAD